MAKSSPAQRFAKIYAVWIHKSTSAGDRANAKRQIDNWLKHYRKTINDIPEILVQAAADDAAQAPSPPPSDPRDAQPHPFEDPKFTPVGLVHGIVGKYLTMTPHVQVIYSLYIVATHVYR